MRRSCPIFSRNADRGVVRKVARTRGVSIRPSSLAHIAEGSLTAKIKAKMVLDDLVKARTINVTTDGTTVTLAGTVHSQQERDRAVALARETDGVTRVVDQLTIR